MNICDPELAEFAKMDEHLQCSEKFFNEDEFISWIVTKNNDKANVPDNEQEYVDSFNIKPTTKITVSSSEISHRYLKGEISAEDYFQNLTEMESFIVKSSQIISK